MFCFISCQEKPLFDASLNFEDGKWSSENVLTLDFEIEEPEEKYDLNLFVGHTTEFEFQNIYLNITTIFPNKNEVEKSIPVDLANKRGKWNGNCNSKKCKLQVYLQEGFKFKEKGKYTIKVEQHSRIEKLEGINFLNLGLFKQNKK